MNESKRHNFKRYYRVNAILRGDNLLSRRLSKPTVAVCKPDQTSEDFPVEVVNVTNELEAQGLDAYTMSKIDIIRVAHRLLVSNPQPVTASAVPAPQTKPQTKAKNKVKRVKKIRVPKPKIKARRRVPGPKEPAIAESPAAVDPTETGVKTEDQPPPPARTPKAAITFLRPYIPLVIGVAILNLIQAILVLLEPFLSQGDVDAKDLSDKLNVIMDEVYRRTVLPTMPTSAKEEHTVTAG